jgi:hypothetical protein
MLESTEDQNEPAAPEQSSTMATPSPTFEPALGPQGYPGMQGLRAMGRGNSLVRMPGEGAQGVRGRLSQSNQSEAPRSATPSIMPVAPSEMPAGGLPGAPTSNTGVMPTNASGGGASTGALNLRMPTERDRSAGDQSQTNYHSVSRGLDQSRTVQPTGAASVMAPPVQPSTDKAFGGFRATSGISPYMNLFRTGTNNGTIDNYTSLVRPALDQRSLNQQFGHDIRGLQNDTRMQGSSLQQLNQTRQLQGVGTPQFYMNYGSYYNMGGQNGQGGQ